MSKTEPSRWKSDFTGIGTAEEQQMAAQAIVDYLHEQHGPLNPQFPYLKVRSVKIANAVASEMKLAADERQEIEKSLTTIFKMVEHDLFADRPSSSYQQWPTDLIVSPYSHTWSTLETVTSATAAVPAGILCWSTVFIICPGKHTQVYSVEIIAYPPSGGVLKAVGSGSSALYMQSQVDPSYYTLEKERNMKALVAASADAANQWIAAWEATSQR